LNRVFNNFKDYQNLGYKESRNIVFVKCCTRPDGRDEEGYPEILKALEEGLRMFDLYSWRKKIYNDFVERLMHYDYYQSETAVSEVLTAYLIANKIGFDHVSLHPPLKNGKNGDVFVTIKGRRLFIEVTSLTERESEMKIRHAFCELAKHLSAKCISKNYAITVYVDYERLPKDEQGHINEDMSASSLKSRSDTLFLYELAGLKGSINSIDYSRIEDKKYLSELVGTQDESCLQPDLAEMIKSQPQAKQWASKIEIKLFNFWPFIAVYYDGGSNGDFVEIHSQEVYSSGSTLEQAEEQLHNHLIRRIRDKISGGQYEQGSPFIIMVKEDISDRMLFDSDFDQVGKTNSLIEKELEKYPWVSGLIIYTHTILDGRYVENRNADLTVKMSLDDLAPVGVCDKKM
jgi:hypothetical protein